MGASVGASVVSSVGAADGQNDSESGRSGWGVESDVSVQPVGSRNDLASDAEHDLICGLVGSAVGPPEARASVGTAAAQLAMRRLAAAQTRRPVPMRQMRSFGNG